MYVYFFVLCNLDDVEWKIYMLYMTDRAHAHAHLHLTHRTYHLGRKA